MAELLDALHKFFGFQDFRPGQKEIIEKVMAGENVLAVMPTGQGKSLCYQLPGLILPGITLVISPLVALMKDQVDSLHTKNLHQATLINGQLTREEQKQRLDQIKHGRYKIIYAAPERLRTRSFINLIKDISLTMLVIDEAHCISQWGHDFRPDYLYIKEFIKMTNHPRVLALTATATPKVQRDILQQLGIENASKVVVSSDRPNLYIEARKLEKGSSKLEALMDILNEKKGSGIIYTATRRETEEVAQFIISRMGIKAAPYHAGMDSEQRAEVQEGFIKGDYNVVVATNAFGMGIDKHDIRFVIHYSIPSSLEAYYQEVGRAGRDGEPARCILFYTPKDRALHEWMIDNDSITREHMVVFWKAYQRNLHNGHSVLDINELDRAGLDENRLRLLIGALERRGIITLLERNSEFIEVKPGPNNMGPETAQAILLESQRRQADRRNKLAFLINWVNSGHCRRRVLLEYFGEEIKKCPPNCCDNCTKGEDEEYSFAPLEVLRCVQQLRYGVGRKKLASILRGSKAKDIIDRDYHLVPNYGKLRNYSLNSVLAMIDRLLGDGYLMTDGDQYPVIELTSQGWEALSMGNPMPVPAESDGNKNTAAAVENKSCRPQNDIIDGKLLAALKEYRGSLARQTKQPAFMIFQDRVLEEIARLKPTSLDNLSRVPGIGPKKLDLYGRDLIAIVGYHRR